MKTSLPFLLSLLVFDASGQSDTTSMSRRVFELGEVVVSGSRDLDSANTLSISQIEKLNRVDVSTALNTLPGISIANVGPRNESVVYVRGFDLRQIPVFIDGIPVYVPYDGYVDMGRFTTFDLAQVSVSKGFSSITYGPNTMGGAINLVSRKPVNKFEINGRIGAFSGEGFRWNVNAGSNLGKFFFQLGASQLKQETFPMSGDFVLREFQPDDNRENAYRDDRKYSAKIGFMPTTNHEIVLGYVNQQGEKGTPPYVGSDPNVRARFWQWPKWDKESLYLISNSNLGEKHTVKTRWYYDTFVNELFSYDDTTYTTITRPYAFQSYYDDYTIGGNAEIESRVFNNNVLKLSIQGKRDIHRENNLNEPQRTFIDNTLSIGLENVFKLSSFTFIPGVSYNVRNSVKAQDYNATTQEVSDFPSNKNNAVNAQLGMFYDFNPDHSLRASLSRKTRFATLKDRYSYRMGQAIPNPDLHAEVALNYDFTYNGKLSDRLVFQASFYRSEISDIIQQVDNVEPGRFQLQNAGDALFYGFELSITYMPLQGLNVGANYSYIQRKNETNPELYFANVPDHKTFAFIDYTFLKRANLLFSLENNSKRYSTSYGTSVPGYSLANAKGTVQVHKYIGLEAGINNIFDKNYSLVEGFPEPGRNYFVNIVFQNL
jgi:iron complex outermembrane receptor protein